MRQTGNPMTQAARVVKSESFPYGTTYDVCVGRTVLWTFKDSDYANRFAKKVSNVVEQERRKALEEAAKVLEKCKYMDERDLEEGADAYNDMMDGFIEKIRALRGEG